MGTVLPKMPSSTHCGHRIAWHLPPHLHSSHHRPQPQPSSQATAVAPGGSWIGWELPASAAPVPQL